MSLSASLATSQRLLLWSRVDRSLRIKRRSTAFVEDIVPIWNDQNFKGYSHISRETYPYFLPSYRLVHSSRRSLALGSGWLRSTIRQLKCLLLCFVSSDNMLPSLIGIKLSVWMQLIQIRFEFDLLLFWINSPNERDFWGIHFLAFREALAH